MVGVSEFGLCCAALVNSTWPAGRTWYLVRMSFSATARNNAPNKIYHAPAASAGNEQFFLNGDFFQNAAFREFELRRYLPMRLGRPFFVTRIYTCKHTRNCNDVMVGVSEFGLCCAASVNSTWPAGRTWYLVRMSFSSNSATARNNAPNKIYHASAASAGNEQFFKWRFLSKFRCVQGVRVTAILPMRLGRPFFVTRLNLAVLGPTTFGWY